MTLAWTDLEPNGPMARPAVLAAFADQPTISTPAQWHEERVPALRRAFEDHVYGKMPDRSSAKLVSRRVINKSILEGRATLEEWRVEASAGFGEAQTQKVQFNVLVALPNGATEPVPVILMETFCMNHNTIPVEGVTRPEGRSMCDGGGAADAAMTFVFGRYISTPPLDQIIDNGYALATFYPSEYVPDRAYAGLAALKKLSAGHSDEATRWGSIAAWAWGFSRVIDVLEEDSRFDDQAMILYGHSRYGKAAIVGAAFDVRADGVLSHQSGTGGAALNREKNGESVGEITKAFPHWFSKTYGDYAGREEEAPIDQHQLLALVAPRPLFLGNARRDVWSDPNGTFVAAQGADAAYELLGSKGLAQDNLKSFIPSADISFLIRPGTHGVTEEDWPSFLRFLNAHFK